MVDTNAFLEAVKESGLTLEGVARKMGFSYRSLYRKARNETVFRISEVEMFCKIVGLSTKAKRERIFLP
jgi:molybdenum-dependent DNA-binding transcriptional regulator ModE